MKIILLLLTAIIFFIYQCQSTDKKKNQDNTVVKTFSTGLYLSNCYIVSQNNNGIIIDPGTNDPAIKSYIEEKKLDIKYIFCTHSHIDHVLFAEDLKLLTGAKLLLHSEDVNHHNFYTPEKIKELESKGEIDQDVLPMIEKFSLIKYDILLKGNETFSVGDMKIEIHHTPGHSKGSTCIVINNKHVFPGDTVYNNTVNNAGIDGDYNLMMKSFNEKISSLEDDVIIYQGHGPSITLRELKQKIN